MKDGTTLYRNTSLFWNFILPIGLFVFLMIVFLRSDMPTLVVNSVAFVLILFISTVSYLYFKYIYILKFEGDFVIINSLSKKVSIPKRIITSFKIGKNKLGRIIDTKYLIITYERGKEEKFYFFDFNSEEAINLISLHIQNHNGKAITESINTNK